MLLFLCALKAQLDHIRSNGIYRSGSIHLWTSLDEAREHCNEAILVVDSGKLPAPVQDGQGILDARNIPSAAILNLEPYLKPRPVTAAGGFVVRPGHGELEILLIFRRGVWDLPKGKLDDGETVEDCALREVREEVGIKDLHLVREAGTTVHGYAEKGIYFVKTTYWFIMQTADTEFVPQEEEDIEQITWMPWSRAIESIGYETLRQHMRKMDKLIRSLA